MHGKNTLLAIFLFISNKLSSSPAFKINSTIYTNIFKINDKLYIFMR